MSSKCNASNGLIHTIFALWRKKKIDSEIILHNKSHAILLLCCSRFSIIKRKLDQVISINNQLGNNDEWVDRLVRYN